MIGYHDTISHRKKGIKITIYGSYWPDSEKLFLRELTAYMMNKGYEKTRIVKDCPKGNLDDLGISLKCLRESDANFFIFTPNGMKGGVTREVDELVLNPKMKSKIPYCVIFDLMNGNISSLSVLTESDIKNQGITRREIKSIDELKEALLQMAFYYTIKLGEYLDNQK